MNHDQTKQTAEREQAFARVGLLRSAQARPVVLTAAQAQFEADNHHDHHHHNHHNHHHDHHQQ